MSDLSSDKKTIKIYNFYFDGWDNPMPIQAKDKEEALRYVSQELDKRPKLKSAIEIRIRDIKIITPVFGVTCMGEDDNKLTWVGLEYSVSGWANDYEFKQIVQIK